MTFAIAKNFRIANLLQYLTPNEHRLGLRAGSRRRTTLSSSKVALQISHWSGGSLEAKHPRHVVSVRVIHLGERLVLVLAKSHASVASRNPRRGHS
jgi:hypothetical protein